MKRNLGIGGLLLTLLLVLPAAIVAAAERPGKAAIASAHFMATEAGHEILAQGGNAFDAAIAVAAALAVVEPTSSGIGGGGFWLLHRAEDGFQVMVDSREKAPAAAHRDMYLDENGEVIALTPGDKDQDQIHMLVDHDPTVPNRQDAILGGGEDPGPALAAMARRLEAAGGEKVRAALERIGRDLPGVLREKRAQRAGADKHEDGAAQVNPYVQAE